MNIENTEWIMGQRLNVNLLKFYVLFQQFPYAILDTFLRFWSIFPTMLSPYLLVAAKRFFLHLVGNSITINFNVHYSYHKLYQKRIILQKTKVLTLYCFPNLINFWHSPALLTMLYAYTSSQKWNSVRILNSRWDRYLKKNQQNKNNFKKCS